MSTYYNEFDPFAAAWLRELMKAGQKMLWDFPQRLVGVYHKTAPAHLVIEDIKECL